MRETSIFALPAWRGQGTFVVRSPSPEGPGGQGRVPGSPRFPRVAQTQIGAHVPAVPRNLPVSPGEERLLSER